MAKNKTILGLESSGRNTISKSLRTLGILHSRSPPKISGIISVRIVVNEKLSLLFSEVSFDIRNICEYVLYFTFAEALSPLYPDSGKS
jgi:hypothetical protein